MNKKENSRIRDLAWHFLLDKNIDRLPVDVFELAESLGYVTVTYSHLSRLSKKIKTIYINNYSFDGFSFISSSGAYAICYNEDNTDQMIRWTIMHEISHIQLGHLSSTGRTVHRIRGIDHPLMEALADGYTRRVLCPSIVLYRCSVQSVVEISTLCGISYTAANYRYEYLQVLKKRNMWLHSPLERLIAEQFQAFIDEYNRLKSLLKYIRVMAV